MTPETGESMLHDDFREALIQLDAKRARAIWAFAMPHLPLPDSMEKTLLVMHIARTRTQTIKDDLRFRSHCWLRDEGQIHLSQLPDSMKQSAERLYPKVQTSVGLIINSKYAEVRDRLTTVMNDVVENHYADGVEDPKIIRPRMMEARQKERKSLLLGLGERTDIVK